MRFSLPALLIFITLYLPNLAAEEKRWYFGLAPETTYGTFSNSDSLKSSTSNAITASSSYLDNTHIFVKARNSVLTLTDNSLSKQNHFSLGFSKYNYIDAIRGVTRFSIFTTQVSGNKVSDVSVTAPTVGFTNYKGTISLDFSYAYSSYKSDKGSSGNQKLTVQQYTAKIGFKPLISNTWLSLKNDTISFQQDVNQSQSINFYWYPKNYTRIMPVSFHVSTLLNERVYAVEHDTLLLYNIDDKQVFSYSVSATWNVNDHWYVNSTTGRETYRISDTQELYYYSYFKINVFVNW